MKVTEEMESAFIDAAHGDGSQVTEDVCAGLSAVFRLIDPVPEDVDIIIDGEGDELRRNPEDPMVWFWRLTDESMFRTYRDIEGRYGPITWEGKSE